MHEEMESNTSNGKVSLFTKPKLASDRVDGRMVMLTCILLIVLVVIVLQRDEIFGKGYADPSKRGEGGSQDDVKRPEILSQGPKDYSDPRAQYLFQQRKEKVFQLEAPSSEEKADPDQILQEKIEERERDLYLEARFAGLEASEAIPVIAEKGSVVADRTRQKDSPPDISQTGVDSRSSEQKGRLDQGLESEKRKAFRSYETLLQPRSRYELFQGTIIPIVLETAISSELPGAVKGKVIRDVYDHRGRHLLIPRSTTVHGSYSSNVSFGQSRLRLSWSRLLFPNKKSFDLHSAPATDAAGATGIHGEVDRHWDQVIFATLIGSSLNAGAAVGSGSTFNRVEPEFSDLALSGASQNINDVTQRYVGKVINIPPTITAEIGDKAALYLMKDIILEEYNG